MLFWIVEIQYCRKKLYVIEYTKYDNCTLYNYSVLEQKQNKKLSIYMTHKKCLFLK